MRKYHYIRVKVNEDIFNDVQEVLNALRKKGLKKQDISDKQNLLFISLLKRLTSDFKKKFIEDHTPVDFLIQQALKEPAMKAKLNQFLRNNQKNHSVKGK